jgi:hypothetical protein
MFEDEPIIQDIPERVSKIERIYWKWIVVMGAIMGAGVAIMLVSGTNKGIAVGLFLAITGMVNVVLMKLWAHIKLSTCRMIWELQNQMKEHKAHSG